MRLTPLSAALACSAFAASFAFAACSEDPPPPPEPRQCASNAVSPFPAAGAPAIPADAVAANGASLCASEWCWEAPHLIGRGIRSLFGFSRDDVWAVGDLGTTLHFDGSRWSRVESGTLENLASVWGAASDDVWTLSHKSALLHWDGSAWSLAPGGRPGGTGLWGRNAHDVWAAHDNAFVPLVHFDGQHWSEIGDDTFLPGGVVSVSGGESLLFALNPGHALGISFNPNQVVAHAIDPDRRLRSVWARSDHEAWVVGSTISTSWDGAGWTNVAIDPATELEAVWSASPTDAWAAGRHGAMLHGDGCTYAPVDSGVDTDLVAIWGSAADDVWAAGETGTLIHWDGTRWSVSSGGAQRKALYAVAFEPGGDGAWAVGEEGIAMHFDGTRWTEVPTPTQLALLTVSATGPDDAWAGSYLGSDLDGYHGVALHWDGTRWSEIDDSSVLVMNDVWAAAPGDIWAVVFDRVEHLQGGVWTQMSRIGDSVRLVRGTAPDDVWIAGDALQHYDGQALMPDPSAPPRVSSLFGRARDDWFAGTFDGEVWHYNGVWANLGRLGSGSVESVWARGPGEVWALVDDTEGIGPRVYTLYRWDGRAWHAVDGLGPELYGFGSDLERAIALGAGGEILRFTPAR